MYSILKQQASNSLSPITHTEYRKALLVIEGACLVSVACSATLASVQGILFLLRIASDPKLLDALHHDDTHTSNNSSNGNNNGLSAKSPKASPADDDDNDDDTEEDDDWEDIRLLALDAVEASIHNSASNLMVGNFFACYGY